MVVPAASQPAGMRPATADTAAGHDEAKVAEGASTGRPRIASLPFRERHWVPFVMIAADIAILEFCLYLGYLVRSLLDVWFPIALGPPVYIGITAGVLALPIAYYLMGLYPGYGMSAVERMRQQVTGTAIVFSSLLAWDYLAQDGSWSRGILLITWLFATILPPILFAWLRTAFVRAGQWGTPVIVIGARAAGERLIRALTRDRRLGLVPVGILDPDPGLAGRMIADIPVIGGATEADELARSIRICAVAMPELDGHEIAELSARLPFPRVLLMPELGGLQSAWVSTRDLGGVLGLEIKKNLLLPRNRRIKRALDYAIGVPLFLFTLPLLGLLALAVVIVSPGRPFYRQRREGVGGQKFSMLKLRTMYPDAEARLERHLAASPVSRQEWERYFKLRDDPRVLPYIGNFMRQSSLDELPQLWNVLRGDMSLVGPRPFPDYHLQNYDPGFLNLRRSVPTGLTGLWQVEVRSEGDIEVQQQMDTYYIRNWSLWLDFYILVKTIAAVVSGRGAK